MVIPSNGSKVSVRRADGTTLVGFVKSEKDNLTTVESYGKIYLEFTKNVQMIPEFAPGALVSDKDTSKRGLGRGTVIEVPNVLTVTVRFEKNNLETTMDMRKLRLLVPAPKST